MLYGNESISQYTRTNMLIWWTMAFQAGLINMGGYMACHEFVSHVTGFATLFGHEASLFQWEHALGMLSVPSLFLVGSMISGQLVDLRLKLHKKPKYYISFGVIFLLTLLVLLLGILGYFGPFGELAKPASDYVLLAILCLVCGIQNGTVTSVSKSIVRTTHLTGILTDLGIGIIRVLNWKRLEGEIPNEGRANLMRVGILFFFVLGSVVGGVVFHKLQYWGFLLPTLTSGILFLGALHFQVFRRV